MVPHRTPFFLPLFYPRLTWRIPTTSNEIFLTFDDGPFPGPTDFVLDQLRTYSAKATFFCIGDNVRKHPDLYRRVVAEGHATGNHTFNHMNGWKTDVESYRSNIMKCDEVMSSLDDTYKPRLFRPPYGKITTRQITALSEYKIVMWDVLSIDYQKNLASDKCARNTIRATRPGSIILFHDSLKAEKNMRVALPRLLNHFSSEGFVFKSL
jgi:peptidoglycan/xylan/chitin deacetylase (PgdA/CDA1 family)